MIIGKKREGMRERGKEKKNRSKIKRKKDDCMEKEMER